MSRKKKSGKYRSPSQSPGIPGIPEASEAPEAPEANDNLPPMDEAADKAAGVTPAPQPTPQEEIAELKDKLLRAAAEMENLRKRTARETTDRLKYANTEFTRDLLTAADNLIRALTHVPAEARKKDEFLETLAAGVEAIERDLMAAFEKHNIRRIDPLGEKFDPERHQAMFEEENSSHPSGTVTQVVQAGYILHDRLVRPALVGIAKGEPDNTKGEPDNTKGEPDNTKGEPDNTKSEANNKDEADNEGVDTKA